MALNTVDPRARQSARPASFVLRLGTRGVRWLAPAFRVAAAVALVAASLPVGAALPQMAPALAPSVARAAADFTVNTTSDGADVTPGDGICAAIVLPPGPSCTLRAAIQEANASAGASHTIDVPAGIYTLAIPGTGEDAGATGDLDVTRSLTITGAGSGAAGTIIEAGSNQGTGVDRVFHVIGAGTSLTLTGMTVRHGTLPAGNGGGILVDDAGDPSLTLNNTVVGYNIIQDNGDGGGIWAGGPVTLNNSRVGGNTDLGDQAGGNTLAVGQGGGIRMYFAPLTLNDSAVQFNSAPDSGGGISIEDRALTVNSSTINSNSAGGFGGGIYSTGPVTINSGTVITSNISGLNGGGIYLGTFGATVTGATIANNTASGSGGGLANNPASNQTTTLIDTTVGGVEQGNFSCGDGGGIWNSAAKLVLTRVAIVNNEACEGNGGGILNIFGGTVTLTDSMVNANQGAQGAGIANAGTLSMSNTELNDNTAWGSAGGAVWNQSTGSFTSTALSTFNTNQAFGGGGLFNEGTANLTDTTFDSNTALSGNGGAILSTGTLSVTTSTVKMNDADEGGGLSLEGGSGTVVDSTVTQNFAQAGGGLYTSTGATVTVRGSTFSYNTVDSVPVLQGAGYSALKEDQPAQVSQAGAPEGGGAALYNSTANFVNVTFGGNTAQSSGRGGALYSGITATTNLSFVTMQANDASEAAGIYTTGSNLNIKNSVLTANGDSLGGANCGLGIGAINSGDANVSDDSSCNLSGPNDLQSITVPALDPLTNYGGPTETFRLPSGHPAVDRVVTCTDYTATMVTTDQRGLSRPQATKCDSGSFELAPPPALSFSSSSYSVAESAGTATLTVVRTGSPLEAVTVDYATSDGTAVKVNDYTATSGTLSWAANDTASKTISVPILEDAAYEQPDETFTVTLSNPSGGAVVGATPSATVTILDNDPAPTLAFSSSSYAVTEGPGNSAILQVNRTGDTTLGVSVDAYTQDGTAVAGADYSGVPQSSPLTLTWAPNDASPKLIAIPLTDDSTVEPSETFNVVLTNPTGGAVLGSPSTATVTITDDDVSLQFSAATYGVGEAAGPAVLTVTRAGSTSGSVAVNYATSDGTATQPGDYTATSGTLSWLAGDSASKNISVPITNDALPEGSEAFTVTLSAPVGASLGTPSSASVTITDDDGGTVQFGAASFAVTESGGPATLTVTRSAPSGVATSVDYATADGSAVAGSDYTATSGTLLWAANDGTSKTITVPITNDAVNELAESFTVVLSNPTGGLVLGAPSTATVDITDDDPPVSSGGGGGGGGSSPPSSPPPGPPPGSPPGPTTTGPEGTAPITPDSDTSLNVGGGAITDGGVTVVVHTGSVDTNVNVGLKTGTDTSGLNVNGGTLLNKTVEIEIEDSSTSGAADGGISSKFSVFSIKKPAEIIINLTKAELGSFKVGDLRGGRVENGVMVNQLPTRIVSESDAIIAIWTDHFSKFSVFSVNTPIPTTSGAYETKLTGLGTELSWTNPPGTTQYQLQVIPFNQDGPGINLVRNAETSFRVLEPDFGGADPNYVMLPGMTYQWRVRTTTSTKPPADLQESDWGAWDAKLFKTAAVSSKTVDRVAPQAMEVVGSLTPTLEWSNSDKRVFYYEVQVSKDPTFGPSGFLYSELRHGGATSPVNSYTVPASNPLEPDTLYHWRVRPRTQGDATELPWSSTFLFQTPPR